MRDEACSCVTVRGGGAKLPLQLWLVTGALNDRKTQDCASRQQWVMPLITERERNTHTHTHTHTHRKASVINDNIFNRDTDRNTINQFPVSKRGTFSTIRASVFIKITWKEKWCIISHTHTHTQWDGNIWNPLKRVGPCEENKPINHTEWVFWKCKNAKSFLCVWVCVCVCVCVDTVKWLLL